MKWLLYVLMFFLFTGDSFAKAGSNPSDTDESPNASLRELESEDNLIQALLSKARSNGEHFVTAWGNLTDQQKKEVVNFQTDKRENWFHLLSKVESTKKQSARMLKIVASDSRRLLGFRASYKMLWAKDQLGQRPVEVTANSFVEEAFAEVLDIAHWLILFNLQREDRSHRRRAYTLGTASLWSGSLYTTLPKHSEMELADQLTGIGYGSAAITAAAFAAFSCWRAFSDKKRIQGLSRWQRTNNMSDHNMDAKSLIENIKPPDDFFNRD